MSRVRAPLTVVWLTVLWLLLWADLSWANLLAGLAIGVVVFVIAGGEPVRRQPVDEQMSIAPVRLAWFVLWVLVKLVQANLILAWEIVTPRSRINTGVIAVPLRTESPTAFMVVSNVITLTPGTVTLEVLGTPPVLYVHVLHLSDVDSVRHDLLQVEEMAVRAFGSRRARAQLQEAR